MTHTLLIKISTRSYYRAHILAHYRAYVGQDVTAVNLFMPESITFEPNIIQRCDLGAEFQMVSTDSREEKPYSIIPAGFITDGIIREESSSSDTDPYGDIGPDDTVSSSETEEGIEFSIDLVGSPIVVWKHTPYDTLTISLRGSMTAPTTYTSAVGECFAHIVAPDYSPFKVEVTTM